MNGVLLAKKRREDLVNVWTAAAPEADLEVPCLSTADVLVCDAAVLVLPPEL